MYARIEIRWFDFLEHIGWCESTSTLVDLHYRILAVGRENLHVGEVESIGINIGINHEVLSLRVRKRLIFFTYACPVFRVVSERLWIIRCLIVGSVELLRSVGIKCGANAALKLANHARNDTAASNCLGSGSVLLGGYLAFPFKQTLIGVANAECCSTGERRSSIDGHCQRCFADSHFRTSVGGG